MNKMIIGMILMFNMSIFGYYYSIDNMNTEEQKANKLIEDIKNGISEMNASVETKAMKDLNIKPISFMGPNSKDEVLKMFYWSIPLQVLLVFMSRDLHRREEERKGLS